MEQGIQLIISICFLVIGSSMFMRANDWVLWVKHAETQGRVASLIFGTLNLLLGSVIIAFHEVWNGIFIIVTILGFLLCFRGIILLLWPNCLLFIIKKFSRNLNGIIKIAGLAMFAISLVLIGGLYGFGDDYDLSSL